MKAGSFACWPMPRPAWSSSSLPATCSSRNGPSSTFAFAPATTWPCGRSCWSSVRRMPRRRRKEPFLSSPDPTSLRPRPPRPSMRARRANRRRSTARWTLSEFQLVPGMQLTCHAAATDYHAQTGRSDPRVLTVITPDQLLERMAVRQSQILAELARVLQLQRDARSQVRMLEIRLHETGGPGAGRHRSLAGRGVQPARGRAEPDQPQRRPAHAGAWPAGRPGEQSRRQPRFPAPPGRAAGRVRSPPARTSSPDRHGADRRHQGFAGPLAIFAPAGRARRRERVAPCPCGRAPATSHRVAGRPAGRDASMGRLPPLPPRGGPASPRPGRGGPQYDRPGPRRRLAAI